MSPKQALTVLSLETLLQPNEKRRTCFSSKTLLDDCELLGSGGNGQVYLLENNGSRRALKMYEHTRIKHCNAKHNAMSRRRKVSPTYTTLLHTVNHETLFYGALHALGRDTLAPTYYGQAVDAAGECEGIVLECMPDTLKDYMPQNMEENIEICIAIMMLLVQMQMCGIVHSDLKLANVLVDSKTRQLRICDWGSACHHDTYSKSVGTTVTMRAPEMMTRPFGQVDACTLDRRALDVWSMGLMVLQLWCRWAGLPEPMALGCNGDAKLRLTYRKYLQYKRENSASLDSCNIDVRERAVFYESMKRTLNVETLRKTLKETHMPLAWQGMIAHMLNFDPVQRATAFDIHTFIDEYHASPPN